MAETIEGFVGRSLDDAKISPLHVRAIALIAAGYFFDVIDLIVLGSLIPDMVQSNFATGAQAAAVGSATVLGMFIGAAGQGEFSDRWGRKTVYQFNLLIFGIFTILGALAPSVTWLIVARFLAGIGLGGEQPLAFAYAGEYSPKRIRGRILAIVHLIGGASVWPIASLFTLAFRDTIGWRGWGSRDRRRSLRPVPRATRKAIRLRWCSGCFPPASSPACSALRRSSALPSVSAHGCPTS